MPGNLNLNCLDFSSSEAKGISQELVDHLFMLKEQLEYTLSNLDASNFNYKTFDELTVRVQNGLDLEGVVTFKALAENAETVINGAYIKTGIVEASTFKTYTCSEDTMTYGELEMYYKQYVDDDSDDALLAGGLRMDDAGLGEETSARFRLWLYTEEIPYSNFKVALKLSSAYRASLEAKEQIYIYCDGGDYKAGHINIIAEDKGSYIGTITLQATMIELNGIVRVNGTVIS